MNLKGVNGTDNPPNSNRSQEFITQPLAEAEITKSSPMAKSRSIKWEMGGGFIEDTHERESSAAATATSAHWSFICLGREALTKEAK